MEMTSRSTCWKHEPHDERAQGRRRKSVTGTPCRFGRKRRVSGEVATWGLVVMLHVLLIVLEEPPKSNP